MKRRRGFDGDHLVLVIEMRTDQNIIMVLKTVVDDDDDDDNSDDCDGDDDHDG